MWRELATLAFHSWQRMFKFRLNFRASSMSLIWIFLNVLLVPVIANQYDVLCPDSDNPFNFPLKSNIEVLVNETSTTVTSTINFIDPRDVACKTNYDDITTKILKGGVNCYLKGPLYKQPSVFCTVDPKCTAQRKEVLIRFREAALKALDEALRIKGILLFNFYLGAKRVLFGDEPLTNLTGIEIFKRATAGRFNLLNYFSVANHHQTPSIQTVHGIFGEGIGLYAQLNAAEEPTGRLKEQNTCIRAPKAHYITESDEEECYQHFLTGFKTNEKLDGPDEELIKLIDKAMDLAVNYLSDSGRRFSGVKIPISGHCVANKGPDPSTSYASVRKTVETIKHLT